MNQLTAIALYLMAIVGGIAALFFIAAKLRDLLKRKDVVGRRE